VSPEIVPAVLSALLLTVIGIFAYTFTSRIRRATRHNKEAKAIVSGIVTEFARRVGEQAVTIDAAQKEASLARREIQQAVNKVNTVNESLNVLSERLEEASGNQKALAESFVECNERVGKLESSYTALRRDVDSIRGARIAIASDESRGGAPLIPPGVIGLGRLTPTELQALNILAEEGPLPATVVQERISKTREHTSRLMKKLFEEGYVERNADRIPYTYAINEKLRRLLARASAQPAEGNTKTAG